MMRYEKTSRLSFSIIKFRFGDANFYLMRKNDKWDDYNFVGGHVEEIDQGNYERAARRELREEVPTSRGLDADLIPLTPLLKYGPIFSKSAETTVLYRIAFFAAIFRQTPADLIDRLSIRSRNRLIEESQLLTKNIKVTSFVNLLNNMLEEGIRGIPLSWPRALPPISIFKTLPNNRQSDFDFR